MPVFPMKTYLYVDGVETEVPWADFEDDPESDHSEAGAGLSRNIAIAQFHGDQSSTTCHAEFDDYRASSIDYESSDIFDEDFASGASGYWTVTSSSGRLSFSGGTAHMDVTGTSWGGPKMLHNDWFGVWPNLYITAKVKCTDAPDPATGKELDFCAITGDYGWGSNGGPFYLIIQPSSITAQVFHGGRTPYELAVDLDDGDWHTIGVSFRVIVPKAASLDVVSFRAFQS